MTLARLIEAVERGGESAVMAELKQLSRAARDKGGFIPSYDMEKAYRGSLDAAERLHDALLPDHRAILDFVLMEAMMFRRCHDDAGESTDEWDMVGDEVKAVDGNMARAWLLAILRAMEGRDG